MLSATPLIDVVCDANVALKWFHADGEEGLEPARALLAAHRDRALVVHVLDLTAYELGNALLRGRPAAEPSAVATVLDSLAAICPTIAPTGGDLRAALELAGKHNLTLYDAAYAAVARRRDARLATFDAALLSAGLGRHPQDVLRDVPSA